MIIDKLKNMLSEQFGIDEHELCDDTNVIEDFFATDLEKVDIAMAIEDRFGVTISDDELSELTSLWDIAEFVEQSLS